MQSDSKKKLTDNLFRKFRRKFQVYCQIFVGFVHTQVLYEKCKNNRNFRGPKIHVFGKPASPQPYKCPMYGDIWGLSRSASKKKHMVKIHAIIFLHNFVDGVGFVP